MALAFRFAWVERRDAAVAFLLAWIIPAWVIFEVVQTKLPHYVLPLYPAMAVLALLALERDGVPFYWRTARWVAALVLLVPGALLIGGPVVFWYLDRTLPYFALPFLIAAACLAFFAMRALQKARALEGASLAIASAVVLVWAAYPFGLPRLEAINLSKRLAAAATDICPAPRYASAGYNEPSLVFLTDTEIDLTDGKSAGNLFAQPGCAVAFIERRFEGAFQEALASVSAGPALRTRMNGININSGRRLDIGVYVRER